MGTLYVVGTPIGNLEDITLRAIRVLREVDLIAAEDTRVTRKLLAAHHIRTPLTSYHEFTAPRKLQRLAQHLAAADLALVSDAGMPGLSDPGFSLISAAIEMGMPVVPIPGPSAILSALVVSGLPMHAFCFLGFLPRKPAERRRLLAGFDDSSHTTIVFESPHRVTAALRDVATTLGADRQLVIARELTKKFEEVIRGTAGELAERFASQSPRGEFTLVIGAGGRGKGEGGGMGGKGKGERGRG